jgi:hypothetical protein
LGKLFGLKLAFNVTPYTEHFSWKPVKNQTINSTRKPQKNPGKSSTKKDIFLDITLLSKEFITFSFVRTPFNKKCLKNISREIEMKFSSGKLQAY